MRDRCVGASTLDTLYQLGDDVGEPAGLNE